MEKKEYTAPAMVVYEFDDENLLTGSNEVGFGEPDKPADAKSRNIIPFGFNDSGDGDDY